MKRFALSIVCCACLLSTILNAQVRLPRLVSNGMVLQQGKPVRIWGWAAPGEKVSVAFNGNTYTATAAADNKWSLALPAMKAGGPYDMSITGSNTITLHDILVGEVWVCSGQSNMDLPMERVKDKYPDVIAHAANPNIRHFTVPLRYNFQSPQEDLTAGAWEKADPISVLHFSATAYFFALNLYEKYHVPIGLIRSSVGGSPAEAWISEDALNAFPAYAAVARKWQDSSNVNKVKSDENAVSNNWYNRIWQEDKGMHDSKKWYDTSYDASAWPVMQQLPGYWEDKGLPHMNGVVWFRKEINIPAALAGQPARLLLGNAIDRDSVYLNGAFLGTTGYQYPPRKYPVAPGLLKRGKNILVVRVINSAGKGGFYMGKPYELQIGGQTIDLKSDWQYQPGARSEALPGSTTFQYQPLGLFNGMIAPLLPYTIKGVIWYQGEANTSRAAEYKRLFPALIRNWRQQWNQGDFPFLFVQLANYMKAKEQPSESQWAELREAQLETLYQPATGMAVAIDIGEWNDIHPLNKGELGRRLALAAQKIAYGDEKVVYSGPIYSSLHIKGDTMVLSFNHTGSGLLAKDGALQYFSIAGADKKWVWAKAVISNNTVKVWNEQVHQPVAVRYAWADNPEGANLYNKEGLPASPFRVDLAARDSSAAGHSYPRHTSNTGLKDFYKNYFPIGVAVSPRALKTDEAGLILKEFNSLTPENAMKMGPIHPKENEYYWRDADSIVAFAQAHGLRARGHTLCWHQQTPAWLFKDAEGKLVDKKVLLQRLKDHITTVVNRYKGKIYAWDVVNEAVDDDSSRLLRNSLWYQICGEDFIAKAFEYAHAADPKAQLFYNDYNSERPEKRERIYKLLQQLVKAHVPINGVGLQAHWSIYEPSAAELEKAITQFSSLGLKVQFTELDISIYPWEKNSRGKRPGESDAFTPELEQKQLEQYKKVFAVFRKYRNVITGVTFWNISDRYTWLNTYPVPGRKNYPLLFDKDLKPKKAYWEVAQF